MYSTRLYSWVAPFWVAPDPPESVSDADSYLHADDSCIFYQQENVKKIENVLNKEFSSLYQWFINNKLTIHFGEDKTKSILFSKTIGLRKINICGPFHLATGNSRIPRLPILFKIKWRSDGFKSPEKNKC